MEEKEKYIEEIYMDMVSEISKDLFKNSNKYCNLINKMTEIVEKYPHVRCVCENKEVVSLNENEVKALIDYLNCCDEINIMQDKKLILMGGKYTYILLKQMNLLKD